MVLLAASTIAGLVLVPLTTAGGLTRTAPRTSAAVTWNVRLSAPPATDFYGLTCPSPRVCVAVGGVSTGVVYRTPNAGASWVRVAVPTGSGPLQWVSCGSTTTCVAAGWSTAGSALSIFVSRDGGIAWTAVPHSSSEPTSLQTLACAGTVCNAVGTGGEPYYRSTNSGATWTEPPGSSSLSRVSLGSFALACPSPSTCFATAADGILKTDDGASSFVEVAGYPSYEVGGTPLSSISCRTALVCTAAGLGGSGRAVAWTRNGGRTWSLNRIPAALGPAVDLSCSSASSCTLVGLANPTSEEPDLVAVSTTNRGASWTVRPLAPMAYASAYPGVTPGGIACAGGHCIAAGFATASSSVFASPSIRAAWTSRSVGGGFPALIAATCASTTVCLAVGGGFVLRSDDDGTTWARSAFHPPADVSLTDVACASEDDCVATGMEERIWPHAPVNVTFLSVDQGATWTLVPSGEASPTSISCGSTTVCLGTSSSTYGELLRTVDGGTTWSPVTTLPSDDIIDSVSCDAADSCLAAGSWVGGPSGQEVVSDAALSTDGGATWSAVTPPGQWGEVDCVTGSSCFALTNNSGPTVETYISYLSSTTDGGQHWTSQSAPSTLVSLVCTSTTCGGIASANTSHGWPGPTTLWTASIDASGLTWTQSSVPSTIDSFAGLTQSPDGTRIVLGANARGGPVILSDG